MHCSAEGCSQQVHSVVTDWQIKICYVKVVTYNIICKSLDIADLFHMVRCY